MSVVYSIKLASGNTFSDLYFEGQDLFQQLQDVTLAQEFSLHHYDHIQACPLYFYPETDIKPVYQVFLGNVIAENSDQSETSTVHLQASAELPFHLHLTVTYYVYLCLGSHPAYLGA